MTNSEGAPVWDGRAELLDQLTTYVRAAWESFEHPRQAEPIAPEDVVGHLSDGLPLTPDDPERTLADAVSVLESSISPSRPLYMAYIGSSGLEAGVLASTLTNLYDVNLATAAGTADALDAQAVRWMGEFVGFPVADGHFTSGGQTSNLTAILAARERAIPGARKNGIGGVRAAVYCSEEAHFSNVRAAEAAGLGSSSVRKIPLDAERRMRADALDARLSADRAEGIVPIVVIATSGTTLTGAVDPLDEIADVCSKHGVWLHVDGAYGLPAAATELAGFRFHGLDRADSVTVDLHKWMGLQKSCSLIMVRDRHVLLHTFGHDERYMLHPDDSVNPVDRTFEYSRPFRALKLWLAFRLYGAEQYRRWITQTLERVQQLAEAVRAHDAF
ncbi:MAG TPA: aminotransferase class V-fold PLP-dependent enzyme, partial [Microbacteriaceae bacterium]|nr:aminotransferase class V-fold PLP-dependent enzyme [Microbacteriaceae bacterium]